MAIVFPKIPDRLLSGFSFPVLRFSQTVPVYQKPIQVSIAPQGFDIFAPQPNRHANIVLIPKTEKALDALAEEAAKTDNPVEAMKQLLKGVLLGSRNKTGIRGLQYFDLANKEAAQPQTEIKPLSVGQLQQTDTPDLKIAHQNTGALVKAFTDQLDGLGPKIRDVTAVLPKQLPPGVEAESLMRELAAIAAKRGYNYRFHRADSAIPIKLEQVSFNRPGTTKTKSIESAIREGQVLGDAMNMVRHLVDSPANFKTTRYISDMVKKLASPTLAVSVHEDAFLDGKAPGNDRPMGLFLSVSQGNDRNNPDKKPRLVEMVYTPKNFDPKTGKTVLLVGKGIIFDTGGNNLKPTMHLHNMRGDMAGAAAVMGTLKALDGMQLENVRVIGLAPLTENRISGHSTLPQDIYAARSGKTVQITDTDAEGRLVLADAMHYGMEKYKKELDAAFTIATLTGGKCVSVGEHNAVGLAGNNTPFLEAVNQVVHNTLRRKTEILTLTDKHFKMVTQGGGGQADVINDCTAEDMKYAGLLTISKEEDKTGYERQANFAAFADGAIFIQAVSFDPKSTDLYAKNVKGKGFVPSVDNRLPWAHLDIAGAEFDKRDEKRGNREWATGLGVEDLYLSVKAIAEGTIKPNPQKTVILKNPE